MLIGNKGHSIVCANHTIGSRTLVEGFIQKRNGLQIICFVPKLNALQVVRLVN